MRILVTAFQPFNKASNNYSLETLKYIENVEKVILDVVYDKCYNDLSSNYNLAEYDLIIAMGEARARNELTLETQAFNIASCSLPDNSGIVKKDQLIYNNENELLRTKINYNKCLDYIKISNDPGKFVCNNLYYHLLANYPEKTLFIHVPNCHDCVDEYIKHAKVIEKIINILLINSTTK